MLKFAPIILAVLYAFAMFKFSAWNSKRALDANSSPLKDPALDQLNTDMANALDLPRIKVSVYEVEPVNGLAAPDGRIFITRGFLNKYKSGEVTAEEIASVIAHELGHVALGHSRRRMIDFSGQNAIKVVMAGLIGRFIPFVGPWVANMVTSLLAARLSRRDEYEADAYASALMTKAGIGTEPQKSLFRKLDKLAGVGGRGPTAWLMSHPKTADRIEAIEANEQKWRAT
jgi:putative metalloprotease